MKLITTFAISLFFVSYALAADETSINPLSTSEKFTILDTDQDGFINMQEAKKLKGLPEKFIAADTDKDGKLVLSEFTITGQE